MGPTVLIVDDDADLRRGMAMLLSGEALATVTTAATLDEARRCLDADVPSHLILDYNLPDGLGTDLLREIRERNLPIRTMLITGSADPSVLPLAEQLGAELVLTKPADWDRVIEWVAAKASV